MGALRAEWTKLWTSPGTIWALGGVLALTVGGSAAIKAALFKPDDLVQASLTGIQLGQAVVAVFAVLTIGGEYSTGMIRVSLAALPHRTRALAAKAAVLVTVLAVPSAPAVAGCLLLPGAEWAWRPALGSVAYLVLIGLLSLGVATAVRDSATAIGIVLGLLYVFPLLAQVASDPHWRRHLEQIGPMSAGLAVQATKNLDSLSIGPWAGLGVLAAWAAGALLLGALLLRFRDA